MTINSLDLKYAKSVLIRLKDATNAKKSDLFSIVKSHQVLDNLLEALENDGYITVEENSVGPKKYSISLTPKGKAIAMELKKADDIASGRSIPKESISVELPRELYDDVLDIIGNNARWKSMEDYVIEAVKEKNEKENPGKGSVKRLPREER